MTTKNLVSDKTKYALAITQAKTNHGLGLLLSFLSIGLWHSQQSQARQCDRNAF